MNRYTTMLSGCISKGIIIEPECMEILKCACHSRESGNDRQQFSQFPTFLTQPELPLTISRLPG